MKKSLKIMPLALTLFLAVTFAGCSSSTENSDVNNDNDGSNTSTSTGTENVTDADTGDEDEDTDKNGENGNECSNTDSTETTTYTVTYVDGVDDAEIAVPIDSTAYHAGDTVTIKFDGIGSRSGYKFVGWSDVTTTYTNNGTSSFTMGSANVILTAQWNVVYIGTKAPEVPKKVGDIVFNDGSSMPYTDYATLSEGEEKTAKKNAAIALIFYKGTGLNSDAADGTPNNTTSRTLGVGLKHNKTGLAWCTIDASACDNYMKTTICPRKKINGILNISGDKNGSDNLEQIADILSEKDLINDTGVEGFEITFEEGALNYPAFYFAKKYKDIEYSNVKGSVYETGWYLPSMAELNQINECIIDSINGFDIDTASYALGGDKFEASRYWSSSQSNNNNSWAMVFDFGTKSVEETLKYNTYFSNSSYIWCVCAIREFN